MSARRARPPQDGAGAPRLVRQRRVGDPRLACDLRHGRLVWQLLFGKWLAVGLENAAFSSRGGELRQLELGRGGLDAGLEVVEVDRGQEVVRAGGLSRLPEFAISVDGGERVVELTGRGGGEHWSVARDEANALGEGLIGARRAADKGGESARLRFACGPAAGGTAARRDGLGQSRTAQQVGGTRRLSSSRGQGGARAVDIHSGRRRGVGWSRPSVCLVVVLQCHRGETPIQGRACRAMVSSSLGVRGAAASVRSGS